MKISERRKQREQERLAREKKSEKSLAVAPADADADDLEHVSPLLSPQDKYLIRNFTIKGMSAFDEVGWKPSQVADFIARPPVQKEIQRLAYLIENGEAILGRQMFLARVELGETVPECLTLIRRALRGNLPDANGNRLDPKLLPDPSQVELAMSLLQTCGIDKGMLKQLAATNVLQVELSEKRTTKDDGRYQMSQVLQRERSRDALEKLAALLQNSDAEITELKEKRKLAKERKSERRAKRGAPDSGVE